MNVADASVWFRLVPSGGYVLSKEQPWVPSPFLFMSGRGEQRRGARATAGVAAGQVEGDAVEVLGDPAADLDEPQVGTRGRANQRRMVSKSQ